MQTHLQKFSTPTESIFARGMDDFIFVTLKREMAQEFLQSPLMIRHVTTQSMDLCAKSYLMKEEL